RVGTVGVEAEADELPAPQLVQDLARLGVAEVIALRCLGLGQRFERGAREGWLERQRLVRGDQTVPAEDGQEPGHAAGRHRPAEILLTGPDPQRGKVDEAALVDVLEIVARLELRRPLEPFLQRQRHRGLGAPNESHRSSGALGFAPSIGVRSTQSFQRPCGSAVSLKVTRSRSSSPFRLKLRRVPRRKPSCSKLSVSERLPTSTRVRFSYAPGCCASRTSAKSAAKQRSSRSRRSSAVCLATTMSSCAPSVTKRSRSTVNGGSLPSGAATTRPEK